MGKTTELKNWLVVALFLLTIAATVHAKTIYVDADVSLGGSGTSWSDAYKYLQDALADADASAKPVEIRVAQGTYKPDQGSGLTPGDYFATFQLINEVTIKGGYVSHGEPDPNKRNIANNPTILSGDLTGNDVVVSDPRDLLTEPTFTDNSFHVVMSGGTDETAILDGFTIRAGGYIDGDGGGMFNAGGAPTLIDCTFTGNRAGRCGGGMYNVNGDPILINCTFEGNVTVESGGGMYNRGDPTLVNCVFRGNFATSSWYGGGGLYNHSFCYPILSNCTFSGNVTAADGGGMYDWFGYPVLTNCTFTGNSADKGGGGMYNHHTGLVLDNSVFRDNSASQGGAMYNYFVYNNEIWVNNCLFIGNWADYGGGMFINYCPAQTLTNCTFVANSALEEGNTLVFDSSYDFSSNLQATNCIFWDGEYEIWNSDESTITINCSDMQGGWWGDGSNNIDANPLFVDADGADNTVGTEDDNLRLTNGSPCIDAGDNTAVPVGINDDLNGFPRFIDDLCTVDTGNGTAPVVDMGAYEFLRSDIDSDGDVNLGDFSQFALYWLDVACGGCGGADLTCDGDVDIDDLKELADNWLSKQ